MTLFRREKHLAPGEPGPDGFRPTVPTTRITDRRSRVDIWGDHALWVGVALATTMNAALTAWSTAGLLAGPYGHTPGFNVWLLGFGLGLVADALWLIMLLLVRRARAVLRTNPAANGAAWAFAFFSVVLIAAHAIVDGASVRAWSDFDLWTVALLAFAAFPILTKILWGVVLDAFYLKPDDSLAQELDMDARCLLADQIRRQAQEHDKRQRQLMEAASRQFAKELGIPYEPTGERPRVELTREDRDDQDANRDTGHGTGQDNATPGHDAETRDKQAPPYPPLPPSPPNPADRVQADNDGPKSIPDVILEALKEGVDKHDKATLRARVEQVHGPIKEKAGEGEVKGDTWRRSYTRAVTRFEKREGFYP